MDAIKKIIKNKKYLVFLDLEGTQFSHEIIALGATKCQLKKDGSITFIDSFKQYVKPLGSIGRFVENMTQIHEVDLKEKGFSFEDTLNSFKQFIDAQFDDCVFLVFGSNDAKMILDSITYSKPNNSPIGYSIVKNCVDFLMIISQYVKDDNGNNYSLINYLKVFNQEPHGTPHDPLNDAWDLMNLYIAFTTQKDILLNEYLKVLQKQKLFPQPIKNIITSLIEGNTITNDIFIEECKKYLA
ncbi:MAG: exonuclease domain-containing protein [Bacillales bacterium]|nr:exonuclease domain-containing protein [Bacillales bacterium]